MRAMRPESSLRTILGPRRPRLRLVDFLVRMWLLKAWPALNLPDAVLRNRFAAARLVLILGMAQLLRLCLLLGRAPRLQKPRNRWLRATGLAASAGGVFPSCSIRLV